VTPEETAEPDHQIATFRGSNQRSGLNPGPGPAGEPRIAWSVQLEDQVFSSPAVVDGVVYVGGLDDVVYAFEAESGAEIWRFTTGDDVSSSPAVVDGVV
jgi:outer membrane protein assembly factor BamB